MMGTIKGILLAAAMCMGAAASYAQYFMVYRNDGDFHFRSLADGEYRMTHRVGDDGEIWVDAGDFSTSLADIDSCTIRMTDVPTLSFVFPDYPDAEQVWDKDSYVSATLTIDGGGITEDVQGLKLQVKGRGNSTFAMPKKPMRLKFDKKTSICGFKKAKNYVLLANYLDMSMMHNALSLWVAREMGLPYTNHTMPCKVDINGKFVGAFLLTEKVGINGTSVDIDEEKGILFELSSEFDEVYKFRSATYDLPVMVKDPDFDELYASDSQGFTPPMRLEMWRDDFENALLKVRDGKGFECFDLDAFVDYMLITNFACNDDTGFPKSVYLWKECRGDDAKYVMGPLWDHDVAYNFLFPDDSERGYTEKSADARLWLNPLFGDLAECQEFKTAYAERFAYFRDEVVPRMWEFIDQYAYMIEPSAKLDGIRWPYEISADWYYRMSSFATGYSLWKLKLWIERRLEFMQKQVDDGVDL